MKASRAHWTTDNLGSFSRGHLKSHSPLYEYLDEAVLRPVLFSVKARGPAMVAVCATSHAAKSRKVLSEPL
eukprot:2455627-Pyramimonas_sp.AAC.1